MSRRVWCSSHAESIATVNRVIGGPRTCAGLSPFGCEQAAALRDRLATTSEITADALYASAYPRATETAEIIAPALGALDVKVDEGFGEHDPGPECDGMTFDAFLERHGFPDWENDPHGVSFPVGETVAGFHHRVGVALRAAVDATAARPWSWCATAASSTPRYGWRCARRRRGSSRCTRGTPRSPSWCWCVLAVGGSSVTTITPTWWRSGHQHREMDSRRWRVGRMRARRTSECRPVERGDIAGIGSSAPFRRPYRRWRCRRPRRGSELLRGSRRSRAHPPRSHRDPRRRSAADALHDRSRARWLRCRERDDRTAGGPFLADTSSTRVGTEYEWGAVDRALVAADPDAGPVPLSRRGGRRVTVVEATSTRSVLGQTSRS